MITVREVSAAAVLVVAAGVSLASQDVVKRVAVNGTELAYVEAGTGQPLLLVHGGMQDYRMWLVHIAALSKKYRVIAISRRNHFPGAVSAEGMPDGAADLHAEDLAGVVKGLGLAQVHVVAHSAGGHAALFFASQHPTLVRTLIVNEPPASVLLTTTPEGVAALKEFNGHLTAARAAFAAGDLDLGMRLFADTVGGPGTFDRRPPAERQMMRENVLAHVADAITTRPRPQFTCQMARRITMPALLVNGANSPVFFHRIVDALAACVPVHERVTIAGASHTVPSERPQEFASAVLGFLDRH
jgi:non-heme chloroperoxidase